MSIYGEEKDYGELVKDNIERANLLYNINDEGVKLIEKLLEKKEQIMRKNGLFAIFEISKINKQIAIVREKYRR